MKLEVTLTTAQGIEADDHAAKVEAESRARNAKETTPGIKKSTGASHSLGYRAQMAFCVWMGIPFAPQDARGGKPNIGSIYKVRGRQRYQGNPEPDLKVYKNDCDQLIFAHITTEDSVTFRLEGWATGAEVKRQGRWRDFGAIGKPAFCGAIDSLHSMETLPVDTTLVKKPIQKENTGDVKKVA